MKIKDLRTYYNLSVKALAKELKITRSAYYAKENGSRKFSALEIQKLCIIFNASISELELAGNMKLTANKGKLE